MSRIGKQPIAIPPKVKVEVKGQKVLVEGPKGKLNFELPRRTSLKVEGGNVVISRQGDDAQAKALHGWEVAKEKIVGDEYDVFLMDEFTYVLHYGWLNAADVVAWLRENKPAALHLIITGRNAPPELIAFADLVTEMKLVKHPYDDQGLKAQPGIEF